MSRGVVGSGRSRRHRAVQATTISVRRMARGELAPEPEPIDVKRPRTRAECAAFARPCPFVGCRHHLYLDVSPHTGSIKLNFPDVAADALEELPGTCSLDEADDGDVTLERTGELMNITRERVRQIQGSVTRRIAPMLYQLRPSKEVA